MRTLGEKVRLLRGARGWKQKDLQERTQISQRYLSALEHGHVDPSLTTLHRLADGLGISVAMLVQNTVRPQKQEPADAS